MDSDTYFDFSFLERFEMPVRTFAAGEKVFSANEKGREMFVVLEGVVSISVSGQEVEYVWPSGILGELALIDQSPRSADAVAVEPSRLAAIDEALFVQMIVENPLFSLFVMRQLSRRIRQMNKGI